MTATHTRRAHTRKGRPVRRAVVHHTPGQATRAHVEARTADVREAFAKAGYAVAVGAGLTVVYAAAAVVSVTAALLAGITTAALTAAGVRKATRRRARKRPGAVSRARRRALRRHKAGRKLRVWLLAARDRAGRAIVWLARRVTAE